MAIERKYIEGEIHETAINAWKRSADRCMTLGERIIYGLELRNRMISIINAQKDRKQKAAQMYSRYHVVDLDFYENAYSFYYELDGKEEMLSYSIDDKRVDVILTRGSCGYYDDASITYTPDLFQSDLETGLNAVWRAHGLADAFQRALNFAST